ncbi:MAG: esterase [Lachnospiraceae bacterium]|nr:esterase [Lachnospiraceae bacterium]
MEIFEYCNKDSSVILVQPVDDHDMEGIENEIKAIRELSDTDFRLIAVKVDSWNRDLSPWPAPAVFGNEDFGGCASAFLDEILKLCPDDGKKNLLGGYSLAGLFALWAAYQTDRFAGIAAASPSVWFPGFVDLMRDNAVKSRAVYLSLGDKEETTRNPVMATVGSCIREGYDILKSQNVRCTLAWNSGNHFKEADLRTARAFAWLMNEGLNK